MEDIPYTPPRLILHLEGANIDELRAQAILALDLRIQTAPQAEAKVADLMTEPQPATTPSPPEQPEPASIPLETLREPKRRGRKPKTEKSLTEIVQTIEPTKAQSTEPAKPITLDAVRGAFDEYVKTFGVSAAQTDGPVLLGRVFGNGIQRIKDIPEDDQGKLERIIAAVNGAILTNEFKRPTIGTMVQ